MKKCTKCLQEKESNLVNFKPHSQTKDGLSTYCRVCKQIYDREYSRKYREQNPEWKRRENKNNIKKQTLLIRIYERQYPERIIATGRLNRAVKNGKIKRMPCEICGEEGAHGHHDDYNKPLKVKWLCAKHHRRLHAEQSLKRGME